MLVPSAVIDVYLRKAKQVRKDAMKSIMLAGNETRENVLDKGNEQSNASSVTQ